METRIYLRALELNDYKISTTWRKDKALWTKLGGTHYYVSEAYEKQWVEQKILQPKSNEIVLAICLKENDEYIGNVYLTDIDWINRNAQFHVFIGQESSRGKGIGTEATNSMLEYAFKERNLHRVFIYCLADNAEVIHMNEKCGLVREGILRQSVYRGGVYKDLLMMSILKKEYIHQ